MAIKVKQKYYQGHVILILARTNQRHPPIHEDYYMHIMTDTEDNPYCRSVDYQWTNWQSESKPSRKSALDIELLIHHQHLFG